MATPSSGVIPYRYTGRYPFVLESSDDYLGFSGVIIEQAMWVLTAELGRYQRFPRASFAPAFQVYRHPSGVLGFDPSDSSKTYELALPRGERGDYALSELDLSGRYLSGDLGQPGSTPGVVSSGLRGGKQGMPDFINDMRSFMSGIPFNFVDPVDPGFPGLFDDNGSNNGSISTDCDHDALQDWLSVKGHPGGKAAWGNKAWTREYYPLPGEIPAGFLGASGTIYDIDFDEVYYQPYPRLRNTTATDLGNSEKTDLVRFTPVFPAFMKTNGTLINVTDRDKQKAISITSQADYFNYDHISSGYLRIDGDVLLSDGEYVFDQSSSATFAQSGIRAMQEGTDAFLPFQPAINRVFIDPPSLSEGQHDFFVRNNGLKIPSGERISSKENAIDVFDAGFWVNGSPDDEPGLALVSPLSGDALFVKFAEELGLGVPELSSHRDMNRLDASTLSSVYRDTINFANFVKWDHDLNMLSSTIAQFSTGGSVTISEGSHFFWTDSAGGTFMCPGRTSGTILHHWTSSLYTTVDAVEYEAQGIDFNQIRPGTPQINSNFYSLGFNDGTTNYMAAIPANATTLLSRSAASGFAAVGLVVGTPNGWSLGNYAELDASTVGLNMPCQPMSIEVVRSAVGPLTAGVWCMFREAPFFTSSSSYLVPTNPNVNPDVYIGRIALTGGKWEVQELYGNSKNIEDVNDWFNDTDSFPDRLFRPAFFTMLDI